MPSLFTSTAPAVQAGVQQLVGCFEALSPSSLDALLACYSPDARFQDPFNEVQGAAQVRRIFEHMFVTVDAPRFVVTAQVVQGTQAFLAWEFHFRMRRWRKGVAQCIRGGTLLQLSAQGVVLEHRDYWDAAHELYEKLPLLGRLMRSLRRAGAAA